METMRLATTTPLSGLRVAPEYLQPPSYQFVSTARRGTTPPTVQGQNVQPPSPPPSPQQPSLQQRQSLPTSHMVSTHWPTGASSSQLPYVDPTGFGSLRSPARLQFNDSYAAAQQSAPVALAMGPRKQSLRITGDRSDRWGI